MPPSVRRVIAVLAGVAVSIVVVMLADWVVSRLHPVPPGTDLRDPATVSALIAGMPPGALILLVAGWGAAAAAGTFVAIRATPDRWRVAGYIALAVLLGATILNLALLPHPLWMWPAALAVIPAMGWLGMRAASRGEVA